MSVPTVADLRTQGPAMLDALQTLVEAESPSADTAATATCAEHMTRLLRRRLGCAPAHHDIDGHTHLLWTAGTDTRVLLLGHLDTVWPPGTTEDRPFRVDDGVATGPGVFDMKAGLVQGVFALAALDRRDGAALLVTSDEEIGSPTSRGLIEEVAAGCEAVLVLEPSAGGALKTGRKGVSMYELLVQGRAAHAGLEPEHGANALVEAAHQVLTIAELAGTGTGTTVTPTVAAAGTAGNVVPADASVAVDVRTMDRAEQRRVDSALQGLTPCTAGIDLQLEGGPNRPPLETSSSQDLFTRAEAVAAALGVTPPGGVTVGGASDGNLTAGVGVPTLDGLGAVGGGAHAETEHVSVAAMPERAALVAGLVVDLLDAESTDEPTDV